MIKVDTLDVKIENLPNLIRRVYPDNDNMSALVDRLEPEYSGIFPFIGVGSVFMKNHFKHNLLKPDSTVDLDNDNLGFFNSLMEGMWHLHVAWSLQKAGFALAMPDNDDDIVIELSGQKIAFEVTLSDIDVGYLSHLTNDKIAQKMMSVAKKKDTKIKKRASGLPTIVVLNEQRVVNDGFRLYGKQEFAERLQIFNDKLQTLALSNSVGVIYSNIKYSEYFAKNIFPAPVLVRGVQLELNAS